VAKELLPCFTPTFNAPMIQIPVYLFQYVQGGRGGFYSAPVTMIKFLKVGFQPITEVSYSWHVPYFPLRANPEGKVG